MIEAEGYSNEGEGQPGPTAIARRVIVLSLLSLVFININFSISHSC